MEARATASALAKPIDLDADRLEGHFGRAHALPLHPGVFAPRTAHGETFVRRPTETIRVTLQLISAARAPRIQVYTFDGHKRAYNHRICTERANAANTMTKIIGAC